MNINKWRDLRDKRFGKDHVFEMKEGNNMKKVYYADSAVKAGIIGRLDFRGPFNVIRSNGKTVVVDDEGSESIIPVEYTQTSRP